MEYKARKEYIGKIGWSGTSTHIVFVDECDCEKFEGTHSHADPYAGCKQNLGMHYRIGPVTQIKRVEPTTANVTCKQCLKYYKLDGAA